MCRKIADNFGYFRFPLNLVAVTAYYFAHTATKFEGNRNLQELLAIYIFTLKSNANLDMLDIYNTTSWQSCYKYRWKFNNLCQHMIRIIGKSHNLPKLFTLQTFLSRDINASLYTKDEYKKQKSYH